MFARDANNQIRRNCNKSFALLHQDTKDTNDRSRRSEPNISAKHCWYTCCTGLAPGHPTDGPPFRMFGSPYRKQSEGESEGLSRARFRSWKVRAPLTHAGSFPSVWVSLGTIAQSDQNAPNGREMSTRAIPFFAVGFRRVCLILQGGCSLSELNLVAGWL